MSLDLEQRLRVFYASAPQTQYRIEVLELSHSLMTQTYFLWKERAEGQVTTEDGIVRTVLPARFVTKPAGSEEHLDQIYEITLDTTDRHDTFRTELRRIPTSTTERVRCVFREYLSDDLTDVQARAALQVEEIAWQLGVAKITAVSPRYNVTRTGELYAPREIPMMRNFL